MDVNNNLQPIKVIHWGKKDYFSSSTSVKHEYFHSESVLWRMPASHDSMVAFKNWFVSMTSMRTASENKAI